MSKFAFISKPWLIDILGIGSLSSVLKQNGHEVDIFAQFNPGEEKVHQDIETYHLMERIRTNIPSSKLMCVFKALYLLIMSFHKAPLAILKSLNLFRYGKKALSLRIFYTILAFIGKKDTYDIIHCHFGPNGIIGVLLKESGINGKIVTTFHAHDISAFIASRGANVYHELFAKGDLFMPICNHGRSRLIELGCNEDKLTIHHMGINLRKFSFRGRRTQRDDTVNIVTVGRLVEKKGIGYAIRAVASIIHAHPDLDIRYRIAGDGPLKTKLQVLVSELNAEEQIRLLGWLEGNEVKRLMIDSDIFVLPSVTSQGGDTEGIPVVLMEALAMGIPVISTYHSGIPELIQDGKSGFLVPERDADALAEKLQHLIRHPELWSEMGRFGRKFVEENYDIKRLNQQLAEIYQGCLAR